MPKRSISVRFVTANPYRTDFNTITTGSVVFNAPPDISDADIDSIVTAIGGSTTAELPPCTDTVGTFRKLQFIRDSGNTVSVPINQRSNLIAAGNTIKSILDGANGGTNPVVCVKLIGEEFANLNDELGVSYANETFAKTHRADATATKQYVYSGTIPYNADSTDPLGGVIFQPVKAISDNANAAATQLGTEWASLFPFYYRGNS